MLLAGALGHQAVGADSPDAALTMNHPDSDPGGALEPQEPVPSKPKVVPRIPDHELLRRIGKGSYGEVWLARNVMGTYRAVKVIYRHSFDTARPFERELSGIQRFEPVSRLHDGLVDILQVGRNEPEGYFYYVMELADPAGAQEPLLGASSQQAIDGGSSDTQLLYARLPEFAATYEPRTLAHELARRGRLPFEECLPLFLSLTSALSHLHQHGLIHRDIKPSSIIFVNGVAKLADIGLVSEAGQSDSYVGTEGYIPPEGPGTVQADIYSLGKLFYELSTGQDRTRFPALPLDPETLAQNKGLLELNAVFVKACASEARDRYASAEEMQADLALLQSGKSLRRLRTIERRLVQATRTGLIAAGLFLLASAAYLFTHYQARVAQTNFERAETQRLRAERAEAEATIRLCTAYLAQARAGRRSGQVGQRFETLAAISNAVALAGTNDSQLRLELRNEAIATLALTDLQPLKAPPVWIHTPNWPPFDSRLERYSDFDAQGNLSLASLPDGRPLLNLATGLRTPARGGGFSPNGRFFGAMGDDWRCRVWNLETKEIILEDPSCRGLTIWRFTPDSRFLIFGFDNGSYIFRAIENGATNRAFVLPTGLHQFAFSRDGKTIAFWNPNTSAIEIRESQAGTRLRSWPHPGEATDIAWSPSGSRLATAGFDRNGYIWDAETGACLQTLRGHASVVVGIAFLGNDGLAVSRSWDSTLRFWDVAHGRQLLEARGAGGRFRFEPRTRRMALVTERGERSFIELRAVLGSEITSELWEQLPPTNNGPWTIDFNADGRLLVSGAPDGFRIWDLTEENHFVHIAGGLTHVSFSAKLDSVLACAEKELRTWPLGCNGKGEVVIDSPIEQGIPGNQEKFINATATPQGYVFVSTESGPIKGFRAGTNFLELASSQGAVLVTASPDGDWIAGSHQRQSGAMLWRAADGQRVRTLATSSGCTVCFSPDSRWLVTGAIDEFRFWETATGSPGLRIKREQAPGLIGRAAFSHDGKVVAVSLSQWLVGLLDVATGRELASLEHPDPQMISCLAFNPSGTHLAVATEGHVVQLWDLRRLSRELAVLGLDWDHPPFPSHESKPVPAHLRLAAPLQR